MFSFSQGRHSYAHAIVPQGRRACTSVALSPAQFLAGCRASPLGGSAHLLTAFEPSVDQLWYESLSAKGTLWLRDGAPSGG